MVQDEGLKWGVFAERRQHQLFGRKADLPGFVEARGRGTEKERLVMRGWKIREAKQGCRGERLKERPECREIATRRSRCQARDVSR